MSSTNPLRVTHGARRGERGAALAMTMIVMVLIGVVSIGVLSVVTNEARVAGSDMRRMKTFYAASAGLEKMTNDFSLEFQRTSKPPQADLDYIAAHPPTELVSTEGFTFIQTLARNTALLAQMKAQNGGKSPTTTIPNGPFSGMFASVEPFHLTSVATHAATKTQVRLERDVNNYLIPLFQFGMFSDKDVELHPGPAFVFNGRVHANGNIYVNGNVKFLDKVTTANELVYDVLRNGSERTGATVSMQVGSINVTLNKGSVNNGPNLPGATVGGRGYFPDAPDGTDNTTWKTTSVAAATTGVVNKFGGQLLTRTTGALPLLLPLQLDGSPTREIIKRALPTDSQVLSESRYHNKAEVRILLDDETVPAGMTGGIPSGKGVALSTWIPTRLGSKVLHRFNDAGSDIGSDITQKGTSTGQDKTADSVRGANAVVNCGTSPVVPAAACSNSSTAAIPSGASLSGRIHIEIVPASTTANPAPTPIDVTQTVLSMGITEGEPNAIVMLQRPLWAAFMQGDRDGTGGNNYLTYLFNNTAMGGDAEIRCDSSTLPTINSTYGFLTNIQDDAAPGVRTITPTTCTANSVTGTVIPWNNVVPINLYNVREGYISGSLNSNTIWTRGITSVVEINMKNFARWVDGVYDNNLLAGTQAVSTNIDGTDGGYILYISDRRGDRVKTEKIGTATYSMTNGMVDNEDIYGQNGSLDPGEDVIDSGADGSGNKKGTLQKDTAELPDPVAMTGGGPVTSLANRVTRAKAVTDYQTAYFRRSVRLVNGDTLTTSMTGSDKLSQTKGISVATENMLYVWGNYNTTGINNVPSGGASLAADYNGPQVPTSLVCDAIFPLSKTWFDASAAIYPDNLNMRIPDLSLSGTSVIASVLGAETSVRAAVIAGMNLSAKSGSPDAGNGDDSRLSGGVHNFPRFLEGWVEGGRRWNYLGSLVPMYYSTQALGPWQYPSTRVIYGAPIRNWAFDSSFTDPNRLPPGTPQFQFVQATGFRETPCNTSTDAIGCS